MADIPNQDANSIGYFRGELYTQDSGTVKSPKNIIQSLAAARALYVRYRTDNLGRINLFSSIMGLIQGNPPYDPLELEQNGLSHIANFNNMDAASIYEQAGLAYWNLLNQAEYLVKFFPYTDQIPELRGFLDTMARTWSDVVREWESFERQVCTLSSQILMYGYSPAVWPDEKDWRWKTIEVSRFLLGNEASTDTELITTIFIETSFTVQDLYTIYEDIKGKDPKDSPWNKEELGRYLIQRANTYIKWNVPILDMMDYETRIGNNDITFEMLYTDEVRLVSLLQKEYDGKISHYMFDRIVGTGVTPTVASSTGEADSAGFLFFIDRQYDSLREAAIIFTASPDKFTIHANRGLGHKIFAPCQATMQLDCDIVNMARLSSTPIVRSTAVGARDFEAIQFKPGVPTNIGTAEFVQNQLGSNVSELVYAGMYLLNKMNTNLAHSGDDPGMPDRNQGSLAPSQARAKSFKEFAVLKNNISHFYKSFDWVIRNMITKMLNSKVGDPGHEFVEDWKDRCKEAGVPDELFAISKKTGKPKKFCAKATRVAGDGSTLALIMGLETLAPIVGSLSAKGLKRYQKDLVGATLGNDYIAAYVGLDEPDEIAGGASLAGTENAIMKLGESPIFSPDNEQRAHITVHLELGKYIVDSRGQQQIDARSADKMFAVLVPHLQEHIQAIANNPFQEQFFNSVKGAFGQLSQYASLNRKNAESEIQAEIRKQQEDQQATQELMGEEQRKNLITQADIQRANVKVLAQNQRAAQANETRAEIMKEKVVKDSDNQRLKIQLEARNKSQATAKQQSTESLPALRAELAGMQGNTISPSDLEPV